jgi:hypothetical protein
MLSNFVLLQFCNCVILPFAILYWFFPAQSPTPPPFFFYVKIPHCGKLTDFPISCREFRSYQLQRAAFQPGRGSSSISIDILSACKARDVPPSQFQNYRIPEKKKYPAKFLKIFLCFIIISALSLLANLGKYSRERLNHEKFIILKTFKSITCFVCVENFVSLVHLL